MENAYQVSEISAEGLTVRTFGRFSITYKGSEIAFSSQNESQIVHLLQLLLHYRDQGVSRDLAKAELFGDRDVEDVSHSIRNIIYNLRKKLRSVGLPDSQYVVKRGGVYFWAEDIPVYEDAHEFAYDEALGEMDDAERMELLAAAVYKYSGRFLAGNDSSVWSVQEAERYRNMFADAVGECVEIARDTNQYRMMYDIGIYAAKVDPFAEWEIVTLEAMSGLGWFDQTEKFYRDTVDAYTMEYGGRTNSYVKEFVNRIGLKLIIGHESLEEIQGKLHDDTMHERRGYFCSLPVFQEIYRITERMMAREKDRVYLMLCTILDSKGNPLLAGVRLEDLSDRLKEAIVTSVRNTDTVTRYGRGQYLILLINTSYEDCSVVSSRINNRFMRAGQRTSVGYSVSNVIVSAFTGGKK